jgi:putative PIN family toxin of toxin-antitoxin system
MTSPDLRVLLDTNIFVSYLLRPQAARPPARLVRAALAGSFTLLTTPYALQELTATITHKPYLAARIDPAIATTLLQFLAAYAVSVPALPLPPTLTSRDPDDDPFLGAALLGQADYLVTGDADLLVLGQVGTLQIISPADFAALLSTD